MSDKQLNINHRWPDDYLIPGFEPYFVEDSCIIYCGDCLEILPKLSKVDLVITSPPYNMGVSSGGGFASKFVRNHGGGKTKGQVGKWSGGGLADGYGIHGDAMSWEEYEIWQRQILIVCWNQLVNGGAIYYNHKPRLQSLKVWLPT